VDLYPDANPKIPGLIGSLIDFQKLEVVEISYHTMIQHTMMVILKKARFLIRTLHILSTSFLSP
jgi:hypothetical protein